MKILFVDDEKIIREGMAELIDWEKLGCDKPAMAESADKALRLLREEPFDLVITDIYMSKMSVSYTHLMAMAFYTWTEGGYQAL